MKAPSKRSDFTKIISDQLISTRNAITEECERLGDPTVSEEVDDFLISSEKVFERLGSCSWDDIFDRSRYQLPTESEYLITAAKWYWLAEKSSSTGYFEIALSHIMSAQYSLGGIGALSTLRQVNAARANKENIEMKQHAIQFWEENIDKTLSNDKAAVILAKQLPLSIRVLSKYISEAKKFNALVKEMEAKPFSYRFIKKPLGEK